jgi:hypothetical protein
MKYKNMSMSYSYLSRISSNRRIHLTGNFYLEKEKKRSNEYVDQIKKKIFSLFILGKWRKNASLFRSMYYHMPRRHSRFFPFYYDDDDKQSKEW